MESFLSRLTNALFCIESHMEVYKHGLLDTYQLPLAFPNYCFSFHIASYGAIQPGQEESCLGDTINNVKPPVSCFAS